MPFFLEEAIEFAARKHGSQLRIGGALYITHPIAVSEFLAEKGYNIEYQLAGLFHDLLEDTDATLEEIRHFGGDEVTGVVMLLTKRKGHSITDYLDEIAKNPMALAVKLADRIHNLRSATVTDLNFRKQYIAESFDYYFIPAILSPFYKEFRLALEDLHHTLTEEFYCKGCKEFHDFFQEKIFLTRDGIQLCLIAYNLYEKSFQDYEDHLKGD